MSSSPTATNAQLIEMWVHGKSVNTQNAYRRYANNFFNHLGGKPLAGITLMDVQTWQLTISRSPNSQRVAIGAIKSLLSFAHQLGIIPSNVGILVRSPAAKNKLAEKILTPEQVQSLIAAASNGRNRAILRLLYSGGLRVSELCQLQWRDLKERKNGGQVTVFGKGDKTRVVLLGKNVWGEVSVLRGDATENDPVFVSNKGGSLSRTMVFYMVKKTAVRAGLSSEVSPHWLRHSHASHSLEAGAPIHLVQKTLGHSSVQITEKYLHARPTDSSGLYLPD